MAAATGKIITIGRSYGAGGRSIGRQVAEDLKIPYYDSELLAETARSSGLDEKYLASVDEKEINDAALYMSVGYMSPTYSSVRQIAANAQREAMETLGKLLPDATGFETMDESGISVGKDDSGNIVGYAPASSSAAARTRSWQRNPIS